MHLKTNRIVRGRALPRTALILVAVGLCAGLLAGCRQAGGAAPEGIEESAMHRANPARTGDYQTEGPADYETIKWQFEAGDWVFATPAVLGDRVYFTSYDGNAYAADRETGAEIWRFESGNTIIASPAVANGLVYIGNMGGSITALDSETGEERWRVELGSGFTGSPAVNDDTVYFNSENGILIALDAISGDERWRFQIPNTALGFSPAVADGVVFVSLSSGMLYAVDAATGQELWNFNPSSTTDRYTPTADPVVGDGVVYFMTSNVTLAGVLFAVDLESHQSRWQLETGSENFSPPAVSSDGFLVWGSLDSTFYGASSATGEILWTFPTEDIIFSAPAIAGDTVYFGGFDKNLYALDYKTGQQRWQFRAESGVSSPAIDDGVVYVGTEDGALYALQ